MLAVNTTPDNTWVIDSGALHHMCNNRNLFLPNSIMKTNYTIRLGDKTTGEAIEQGIIPINQVHVNALFVPCFRVSLLSVSQLDSQLKWFTTFAQGECRIHDSAGNVVLKTPCSRGLYQVRISEIITAYHVKADALPKPKVSTEFWHRRLAHIHPAAIKRLLDASAGQQDFGTDKLVDNAPETCETCIKTKLKQRFNRQPVKCSTRTLRTRPLRPMWTHDLKCWWCKLLHRLHRRLHTLHRNLPPCLQDCHRDCTKVSGLQGLGGIPGIQDLMFSLP